MILANLFGFESSFYTGRSKRKTTDLEFGKMTFLGATKHLYNRLCPSVGRLVCNAFVRQSTPSHLLTYLALFLQNAVIWKGIEHWCLT